jgi:leucyl-tRNA synthetase
VLYDAGIVSTPEPFQKLVHQGIILGELEFTVDGERVDEERVEKQGDRFVLRDDPKTTVEARAYKMSKARGNVVNPDGIVARYGADAFRLYEMFLGPLEQVKPWNTRGVEGMVRFLNRAWRLIAGSDTEDGGNAPPLDDATPTRDQQRLVHQTIAKVTEDIEAMRFNTAISALMELTNAAYNGRACRAPSRSRSCCCLPLAPHLAGNSGNGSATTSRSRTRGPSPTPRC